MMSGELIYANVAPTQPQNQDVSSKVSVATECVQDLTYSEVIIRPREQVNAMKEATDPDEDVTYSEVRTGVKEQVNPGKGREPCCDELSSPVESKFVTPERGCWRFAMVILVCLCVVLLGLTITLGILYALQRTDFQVAEATFLAHISQMKENITELQQSKTNVTAVNNNLTSINAQLQTKIQNCTSNLTEVNNLLAIAQAKHCSSDWIFFNGSCYYFSNDIMTWKQSKYACIRDGGHLVIIESLQEQEFLRIKVGNPDYADSPWIGMTDQNTEGTWVWVDNTTLNNNNKYWDQNNGTINSAWPEPNNSGVGEDCAGIGKRCSDQTPCWFDFNCVRLLKRICESRAASP